MRGPRVSPAHRIIPGKRTASGYLRSQTNRFSPTSVLTLAGGPPRPKDSDSSPDGACDDSVAAAPGAGVGLGTLAVNLRTDFPPASRNSSTRSVVGFDLSA